MLTGHCACGSVRYEADAELGPIIHCHCETCRRTHASAFSSIASVPRERFRWVAGEDLLSRYESSPGKFRHFCSRCGSHVMAERAASPHVMLRLGCLDNNETEYSSYMKDNDWRVIWCQTTCTFNGYPNLGR